MTPTSKREEAICRLLALRLNVEMPMLLGDIVDTTMATYPSADPEALARTLAAALREVGPGITAEIAKHSITIKAKRAFPAPKSSRTVSLGRSVGRGHTVKMKPRGR